MFPNKYINLWQGGRWHMGHMAVSPYVVSRLLSFFESITLVWMTYPPDLTGHTVCASYHPQ